MSDLPVQCCVCQRLRLEGEWLERELPLSVVRSHGYCPVCMEAVMKDVRRFVARHRRKYQLDEATKAPRQRVAQRVARGRLRE